jgi:hypothetical protein
VLRAALCCGLLAPGACGQTIGDRAVSGAGVGAGVGAVGNRVVDIAVIKGSPRSCPGGIGARTPQVSNPAAPTNG